MSGSRITSVTPLLLWLLVLCLALVSIMKGPPIQSDLAQFLPAGKSKQQKLLLDELSVGAGSRVLIVALSGGTLPLRIEASKQLVTSLAAGDWFERVFNGAQQLREEERKLLFSYRYLLVDEDFSAAGLRAELQERLVDLSSPLSMLDKSKFPADPTALMRSLLQSWGSQAGPNKRGGVWFSQDSTRALILLQTRAQSFELDRQSQAIDEIYRAFRRLPDSHQLQLTLSGGPLFAVEARQSISEETRFLSVLSSLGIILLLWWMFRSLKVLLIAVLPLMSAVVVAVAAVIAHFGSIHGITLAFGITLIGISVDYPIHYFSHLRFSQRVDYALKHLWRTLFLGVITTVLGFSSLVFSGFDGLVQLGVFAVCGLVTAAVVTRFVLPQILSSSDIALPSEAPLHQMFLRVAALRHLSLVPLLFLLTALFYLTALNNDIWESRLSRLSPISEQAKQKYDSLRNELLLEDSGRLLIIRANDQQQLLGRSELLAPLLSAARNNGVLASYELPSSYIPSARLQRQRQSALPDSTQLASNLQLAMLGLPFKPDLFAPFVQDVEQSRTVAPLEVGMLHDSALGMRIDSLLRQRDGEWFGVVKLTGISDEMWLRAQLAEQYEWLDYMDLHAESSQIVADYLQETLFSFMLVAVFIALLLMLVMRSPQMVWRVMLPVVAAVLLSASLQVLLGERLSLFHVAALLLVMGFGLDYSIFMVRTPICSAEFSVTIRSLLICNASTLLVFGLLASSEVPVLHSIGLTVTLGAFSALLFSFMMVRS